MESTHEGSDILTHSLIYLLTHSLTLKGMTNSYLEEIINAKKNEKIDIKEANRIVYLLMNLPTEVFSGNARFKQLIREFLKIEYANDVNLSVMIPCCAKHG